MSNENEFDPTAAPKGDKANLKNNATSTSVKAPSPVLTPEKTAELKEMAIPNVADKPFGDASLSDEALLIKEKLSKEPKITFFVPLDPGEKPGAYRSVTINGYRCEVKKGVMVALPQSIAKLLMNAYQIEADVLNNNEYNLANKDQGTRNALNA